MPDITSWLNHEFDTSTSKTPEFLAFARDFEKFLKNDVVEIDLSVSHFYLFGFARNITTGKFAYFTIPDVRFFDDYWFLNILYRTAQNSKDYRGGVNQYCQLPDLVANLVRITS